MDNDAIEEAEPTPVGESTDAPTDDANTTDESPTDDSTEPNEDLTSVEAPSDNVPTAIVDDKNSVDDKDEEDE
ncbi:MAG: hypothetical protein O2955_20905 [Planctomycetota bacterium]|nr:hypothetical protein [Planctomycetota bacterium]MDA1214971.1 hypothetical protein [Planctomycetota bacterium]